MTMQIQSHFRLIAFCVAAALTLFGCADQKEEIPSYIKLTGWEVLAPGGVANHKLTHAFLYVDNKFLGGYPVPGLVPVLGEGNLDVEVHVGIRENGSRQTPTEYPLMEAYKAKIQLTRGQETELVPKVGYFATVKSVPGGEENFDGGNVLPTDDIDTDQATTFSIGTIGGYEGKYAKMNVDTAHAANWVKFRQAMEGLPFTGGQPVFLEMHYKNDTPFELILLGTDQSGITMEQIPVYEYNKSANWNKIYINLTDFLSSTRYAKYHLQFRCTLPRDFNTGKFTQDSGSVYLDNLRILYF
jgi:hypothetical protein